MVSLSYYLNMYLTPVIKNHFNFIAKTPEQEFIKIVSKYELWDYTGPILWPINDRGQW